MDSIEKAIKAWQTATAALHFAERARTNWAEFLANVASTRELAGREDADTIERAYRQLSTRAAFVGMLSRTASEIADRAGEALTAAGLDDAANDWVEASLWLKRAPSFPVGTTFDEPWAAVQAAYSKTERDVVSMASDLGGAELLRIEMARDREEVLKRVSFPVEAPKKTGCLLGLLLPIFLSIAAVLWR